MYTVQLRTFNKENYEIISSKMNFIISYKLENFKCLDQDP